MQHNMAHNLDEKQRTKDVLLEENVTFTSLLLSTDIKKGLEDSGFKKPSPVQFKAIPLGRCGFDLIVKSKSGTGKTLVFSTIALETVNVTKEHLQVLILVPTREIAVQIQDVLRNIGRHIKGLSVESFIGGMPVEEDVKKAKTCHIAVGAPGRVKHLINLGSLSTRSVRLFVLDEADKLMESTFKTDINEIYDSLPQRKQLIAASATYPKELDTFLANYMLSPTHVTSEKETPLLLGLKHFVAVLKANTINAVQQMKAKNEILLEIFSKVSFTQCLVFTNYQTRTESVCNFLNQKGWTSSFISAAVDQSERLEAINNLKNFKSRILLSTDLTSRGIDAPNVDLVINYDLPHDAVTYLHRMGRAGRYGSSGICISFALEGSEIKKLQLILGTIGATNLSISKLPPLNGNDLWQLDPNSLEQIWGIVPSEASNETSESIKKEVLTLKQRKSKEFVKSGKNGKKKIKLEELSKSDCVQTILKSKKEETENSESSTSLDAEDLLNSLVIGENNYISDEENKKRKRGTMNEKMKLEELSNTESVQNILTCKKTEVDNLESPAGVDTDNLLNSLLSGLVDSEDDSKKRKLNKSPMDSQREKFEDDKQVTFSKNKALLSISRLLFDDNTQVNSDLVNPIEEYLTIFKKTELRENSSNSVEEILGSGEGSSLIPVKKEEINVEVEEMDLMENIFKIGYGSALKVDEKGWLNCLPADELQRFQEFCKEEQVVLSSENEDEDEDEEVGDYQMGECAEEDDGEEEEEEREPVAEEGSSDLNNDSALQWVPVVQNEDPAEVSNNHFAECYDDCSNALWQNGLTFETVSEFDDWYYHWQEHLQSVRNYVQQNIYVEEMSKYQQNRLTNK